MQNKVLIGLSHSLERKDFRKKEVDWLKKKIQEYHPLKVGIELPEDYLEREEFGLTYLVFSDIASYLKGLEIVVIPLENPELRDYTSAFYLAKDVIKGKEKRKEIESNLKNIEKRDLSFSAPEQIRVYDHLKKTYRTALEILDIAPTLEKMMKLEEDTNRKRENYMLQKIVDLDILIIGDGHAQYLKERLPEHEYVKSPFV
jgi:hypothetical protein